MKCCIVCLIPTLGKKKKKIAQHLFSATYRQTEQYLVQNVKWITNQKPLLPLPTLTFFEIKHCCDGGGYKYHKDLSVLDRAPYDKNLQQAALFVLILFRRISQLLHLEYGICHLNWPTFSDPPTFADRHLYNRLKNRILLSKPSTANTYIPIGCDHAIV